MAEYKGTDMNEGCSGWCFIETEAECDRGNSDSEVEDDEFDIVDLVDNANVVQGNTLAVYNQQTALEDEQKILQLKRKFMSSPAQSPEESIVSELSPRLCAISIGKKSQKARRKLFDVSGHDSGVVLNSSSYGDSMEGAVNEAVGLSEMQVQNNSCESEKSVCDVRVESSESIEPGKTQGSEPESVIQLLKTANPQAALLAGFKDLFGVSFCDLTRVFKSNKTCCEDWVLAVFMIPLSLADSVAALIQPHCVYSHISCATGKYGVCSLMLCRFKASKSRETVKKLLVSCLHVSENLLLVEPPKLRSAPAAMFWYRKSLCQGTEVKGEMLEWIAKQVLVSHQASEVCQFELSNMVQWAYDNDFCDEATIAYEYALCAEVDANAEAFLKSNCQAKYVKDCYTMVKHYKKAEMQRMSMAEWVKKRAEKFEGDGDYRPIVKFLKHQNIEFISFLNTFRMFLKGIPKKNCLVICGPPNTGKSLFSMSLLKFLGGKVISFANYKSHFWLQPLGECKVGLLDDATDSCWDYFDVYLRNFLDGNEVSLDMKHRAPIQIKCPPLLVTTNVDIRENLKYRYLYSRVTMLMFKNECPLTEEGELLYAITPENWKSFFTRLWARLDIEEDNSEEGNGSQQAFRCSARAANGIM